MNRLAKQTLLQQLLFILCFVVTSCAFDQSPSQINQRENKSIEEKNRVLRTNYDLVTGFYQGKLKLANEERTVTLGIYTLEVKEGTNSSGEPVFKPMLKAVYRQIYPVEVPIVLDGRFVPETGELSFLNSSSTGMDTLHTINGLFHTQKITGEAKTPTGLLGQLELSFVQKKVDAPMEGDDDHIAQKLRQQFEIISGTYVGKITSSVPTDSSQQTEWDIELGVYSLEVKAGTKPNGETLFRPVLKAVFKQKSPVVPNIILEGQFIAETGQIFFVNPSPGSADIHTITANLNNQKINGIAKRSSGLWGDIHLDLKTKSVTTDPSGDENEFNRKLREQYESLTGTYKGKITRPASGNDPKREWKSELSFFIIDVKYGTLPSGEPKFRPALKARFRQLAPVAPNVLLDVQYIAESQQILLSTSDNLSPVDALNSISATLENQRIKGKAAKLSGYWGDINLEFSSKNVDSPPFGDQEDFNRRLTDEFQTLVGNYTGTVSPRGLASFGIELKVFIVQEAGPNGIHPALKAYYKRNSDRFNATDLTMNVEFKTELTPSGVDMSGQRSNGAMTYFVVLNGTFQGREIRGIYHDQRGQEGPFVVRRNSR